MVIWGPDGFDHEKNGGRKSRDTIPLTGLKMFASLGAVFGNVSERDPIVSRDFLGLRRILLSTAKAPCTYISHCMFVILVINVFV